MHTMIERIPSAGAGTINKEYAVGCYVPREVHVLAENQSGAVATKGEWNEIAVFEEKRFAIVMVSYLNGGEWPNGLHLERIVKP